MIAEKQIKECPNFSELKYNISVQEQEKIDANHPIQIVDGQLIFGTPPSYERRKKEELQIAAQRIKDKRDNGKTVTNDDIADFITKYL